MGGGWVEKGVREGGNGGRGRWQKDDREKIGKLVGVAADFAHLEEMLLSWLPTDCGRWNTGSGAITTSGSWHQQSYFHELLYNNYELSANRRHVIFMFWERGCNVNKSTALPSSMQHVNIECLFASCRGELKANIFGNTSPIPPNQTG
jgi:hypothetical protein